MKILINALSGIGDALMFSPSLALLKKHLPDSEIHLLSMFPAVRDIYSSNPNLNYVHFINFLKQPKLKSLRHVLDLRKKKFDVSINVYPSNRKEYNIINYIIGADLKIAVKYNNLSRRELDFLNNRLSRETLNLHNVIENFRLIKFLIPGAREEELDKLELYLKVENLVYARKYIFDNSLEGKFLVGIHAGSATFKGHVNKRWKTEKYAELAKLLHQHYDAKILIFGSEEDINRKIYDEIKDFAYIPLSKNISDSAALMKSCKLFISGDTGLMHMAAALQIPQVAIFGYTNYNELHPWMNKHIIVRKDLECSPCFYNSPRPVKCIYRGNDEFRCIKTISVEEVLEACRKLIEEVPRNVKT
ncbi:MAG: glycosyltransferase family 9 protein [Ignavibacteria bacterium]|nr:glycosyltransferase family 9 protein [Ignavibacteria bacterium]